MSRPAQPPAIPALSAVRLQGAADASVGRVQPIDWPHGFDDFLVVGPTKNDKLAAPAWLPATIRPGGRRCDADVQAVHALVLDYDVDDKGVPAEDILARWEGYERVLHSTWTPGRWRVVLPYRRPHSPEEHARVYAWAINREGDLIDGSCKNPSRLFFWPCIRSDVDDDPTFGYAPGELLDVEAVAVAPVADARLVVVPSSSSPLSTPSGNQSPAPDGASLPDGRGIGRGGAAVSPYSGIDRPQQVEDLGLIESRCAFMARARDAAATLPEPEWYAALSVWSRCRNGDELAHERSRPYAGYSPDETSDKLERAKLVGPTTCTHVRTISPACAACPLHVTSPVLLGRADPVATPADASDTDIEDAKAAAEEALETARGDKRLALLARERARRRLVALRAAGQLASDDDIAAAVDERVAADEACAIAERVFKARERDLAKLRAKLSADGLPPGADAATWQRLRLVDGRPVDSVANVMTVLGRDPAWGRRLAYDAFALDVLLDNDALPETAAPHIALTLAETYGLETSTPRVLECVRAVAEQARTHPVRDWLEGLRWDGVPRAGRVALEGFYVDPGVDEELVEQIGTKLLISMVARVMRPGCKVDTMTVLTGPQGAFKSTALEALVPDRRWFARTKLDLLSKDSYLALRGKWLYEFAELSSMKLADSFISKGWISNDTDTYRAPYARRSEDHPRQTVTVGSDNEGEFLVDPTGWRRYWPLPVTLCRPDWIAEHREQMFAEAAHLYRTGTAWWFDERSAMADRLRQWSAPYATTHPWTETAVAWLRQSSKTKQYETFTVVDVLTRAIGKQVGDLTKQDQLSVAGILRQLSCERVGRSLEHGHATTLYRRPAWLVAEQPLATVLPLRPAAPGASSENISGKAAGR